MKIVKCDYTVKVNFEVKIIVLPFGCILINKVHCQKKCSGTQNLWNFVIWRGMNDAVLIFVSSYVQFYLRAKAVMTGCFSLLFPLKESKDHQNGFSKIVTYYSLALFVLIESWESFNRFLFAKQSLLVWFKVRQINPKSNWFFQTEACAQCTLLIKRFIFKECFRYFAVFYFDQQGGEVPKTIKKLIVFEFL